MADYAIHDTTLTDVSNVIRKKDGTSALIDPVEIDSKLGNNTIWSEQGSSVEVTYRADINLALGGQ